MVHKTILINNLCSNPSLRRKKFPYSSSLPVSVYRFASGVREYVMDSRVLETYGQTLPELVWWSQSCRKREQKEGLRLDKIPIHTYGPMFSDMDFTSIKPPYICFERVRLYLQPLFVCISVSDMLFLYHKFLFPIDYWSFITGREGFH